MKASLSEIQQLLQRSFSRLPVILSGEKKWCFERLSKELSTSGAFKTSFEKVLLVSQENHFKNLNTVPAERLNNLLGSEVDAVIWDGFSGLNPSALGAASGLVKGGGVFILCLPELSKLSVEPDPDYIRLCALDSEISQVNTFFLQGMCRLFEASPCAIVEQTSQRNESNFTLIDYEEIKALPAFTKQVLPTTDQLNAIEAIKKVSQGHRNRPLVISADRGRGKTSTLGIAAAKLQLEFGHSVIITAPNKKAVSPFFEHFSSNNVRASLPLFYSPDQLLIEEPECHLLMIDEAAAIPNSILKRLVARYKRIIFATTIHGYEGSGRGFEIRFKKYLDENCLGWKAIHMAQPIRWTENDPLERWTERLLYLKAKEYNYPRQINNSCTVFRWVSQSSLYHSPPVLDQTISLLVNAHYQTTPDDIRLILDHPKVKIGILENRSNIIETTPQVIGVILTIEEGQIIDQELSSHILQGKRRLRGHVTPQSLATSIGSPDLLSLSYLRIIRIAVASNYENLGFGSQLIQEANDYCLKQNIDFLSTSFGLNKSLIHFWLKNNFQISRLGTRRDSSTGTYSSVLCLSTSEKGNAVFQLLKSNFEEELLFGISRQYRNHNSEEMALILNSSISKSIKLTTIQKNKLERFSAQSSSYNDIAKELYVLLLQLCYKNELLEALKIEQAALMIAVVLQGRTNVECVKEFSLSGKKELDKLLRDYTLVLLRRINSPTQA